MPFHPRGCITICFYTTPCSRMMAFRTQPTGCDTIKPHFWLSYHKAPAADTFDCVELLGIDKGRPTPQGIATSCTSLKAAGAVSSSSYFCKRGYFLAHHGCTSRSLPVENLNRKLLIVLYLGPHSMIYLSLTDTSNASCSVTP